MANPACMSQVYKVSRLGVESPFPGSMSLSPATSPGVRHARLNSLRCIGNPSEAHLGHS